MGPPAARAADLVVTGDPSDPQALVLAAHRALTAPDGMANAQRAVELVRAACAKDYPKAWRYNATLAILGVGQPQSFEIAFESISRAAALGDESAAAQIKILAPSGRFDPAPWFAPSPAKHYCDAPRVYTVEGFLAKPICDWFIAAARPRLQPTRIKTPAGPIFHEVRNSSGAGFSALETDLIVQLTRLRMAAALGVPVACQEDTNVLHYGPGQEYKRHYDFITPGEEQEFADELRLVGQRVVTLLVYLNDDYEGGETEFPRLNWRYKGKAGDALIFWNLSATGEREPFSLHGGLPVESGEKWLLSQWVRQRPTPLR